MQSKSSVGVFDLKGTSSRFGATPNVYSKFSHRGSTLHPSKPLSKTTCAHGLPPDLVACFASTPSLSVTQYVNIDLSQLLAQPRQNKVSHSFAKENNTCTTGAVFVHAPRASLRRFEPRHALIRFVRLQSFLLNILSVSNKTQLQPQTDCITWPQTPQNDCSTLKP